MIRDQSKKKIQINGIEIEGLVDTGGDVTIMSPKSWYAD
jgi:cytoskeletal protein CcmA (bactofilin family)